VHVYAFLINIEGRCDQKWVAHSTCYQPVSLNPIKDSFCFLKQDTLRPLLSTGCFQELLQM